MFDTMFSFGAVPSRTIRQLSSITVLLLGLVLPTSLPAQGRARAPIVTLAQDSPSGTDDYYLLDLGDGALTLSD